MANSLVVRSRTDLVSPSRAGRAAQYVRMSTDHQRYSTQNQAAAIAVLSMGACGRMWSNSPARARVEQMVNSASAASARCEWIRMPSVEQYAHHNGLPSQAVTRRRLLRVCSA